MVARISPAVPVAEPRPVLSVARGLALLALALVAWRLSDVIMLAFGAALIAVLLHALAEPLVQRFRLARPVALTLAVAAVAVVVWASVWLFGQQVMLQVHVLAETLPRAWSVLEQRLSPSPAGLYLLEDLRRLRHPDGALVTWGSRIVSGSASAAVATLIVSFAGLYLAFHPSTYLNGALRLLPRERRPGAEAVLQACGLALNRWLLGQVVSMILVAATVAIGLSLAGVPSAIALGLIAGLGQLVPVLGPMVTTLPGLIVAAAIGPEAVAWTLVVYIGAMQFEANVITPLVLRRMVEVPMAVTLFAVLAMGMLFGGLGVLFATPLVVVAFVVIRLVYVEGLLGDRVPVG
jgi:predicted PurR-regulated permease PerM